MYFLDSAKTSRLIDHDPCLFCKDAEFKVTWRQSSLELLQMTSAAFVWNGCFEVQFMNLTCDCDSFWFSVESRLAAGVCAWLSEGRGRSDPTLVLPGLRRETLADSTGGIRLCGRLFGNGFERRNQTRVRNHCLPFALNNVWKTCFSTLRQASFFRPSATLSRISLMESCTCHHCHCHGGLLPHCRVL